MLPTKKKPVRKPRVPRTRAGGKFTEAQFWSFIRSGLRSKWMRWPPRYVAKANVKRTVKGKRHKSEFQCAECSKWFKDGEVQIDHIEGCGSLKSFDDLPQFVEKLFCESDGLQVLCKPCHKIKTAEERANARKTST